MSKLKLFSKDKFVDILGDDISKLPDPRILAKRVGGKGDIRCIVDNNNKIIGIGFENIDVWCLFCAETGMSGDHEEMWFDMKWDDTQG